MVLLVVLMVVVSCFAVGCDVLRHGALIGNCRGGVGVGGWGGDVVLAPGSEDAMFAAVCRLARISRERRKGNFVRYEGGGMR